MCVSSQDSQGKRLLPIGRVAEMLGCSTRKIYSLVESRMMPSPIRLGGSIRWDREVIEQWISDGCPRCQKEAAT